VQRLVTSESAEFTDYLNFFEFVVYLRASKQIRAADIDAMFSYYLACLSRHPTLKTYIKKKGFEYLAKALG
jgi:hypothetical protein